MEKILVEEKTIVKKKVPFIFAKTTKQIEKKIFCRKTENLSPLKKNNLLQKNTYQSSRKSNLFC